MNDEADDSEVVRPERPLAHRRHLIEKGDDGSQGETSEKELYIPFKDTDTTEPGIIISINNMRLKHFLI